jgi:alkaline phosphatase D
MNRSVELPLGASQGPDRAEPELGAPIRFMATLHVKCWRSGFSVLIAVFALHASAAQVTLRPPARREPTAHTTAASSRQAFLRLAPMLGHVSSTNAFIWAHASTAGRVSIRLSENEDLSNAKVIRGPVLEADNGFMGHVVLGGLAPETRYFYSVLLNGKPAMLRPYPSFVTAPPEGTSGRVRFAFTSCVGFHGYDASPGYADLARTNVDFLLMLGDNAYSNTNDPAVQRRYFFDQRDSAGWRGLSTGTPIYAIWDDHDFGPDNSDGRMKGKEKSLKTFTELWANPAYGEPDNPGVYFKFSRRDVDLFMLDGRYHRDPNKATNLTHKTMLGAKQLDWFKRELAASKAKVKVLVSGGEWQIHGTDDSWKSFKKERDEIFKFIQDERIEGVLLLSGDRHFTGAYQVEGKWIEVTVGPLGSSPIVTKNAPEMFLNFSETKGHFYCVYDVDTAAAPPQVTLEVYRAGDGQVLRRPFTWDEVNGVTKIKLPPPAPKPEPKKDEKNGAAKPKTEAKE